QSLAVFAVRVFDFQLLESKHGQADAQNLPGTQVSMGDFSVSEIFGQSFQDSPCHAGGGCAPRFVKLLLMLKPKPRAERIANSRPVLSLKIADLPAGQRASGERQSQHVLSLRGRVARCNPRR